MLVIGAAKRFDDKARLRLRTQKHGNKTWLVHRLLDQCAEDEQRKVLIVVSGDFLHVYGSQGVEVEVVKCKLDEELDELARRGGFVGETKWRGLPHVLLMKPTTDADWIHLAKLALCEARLLQLEEELKWP